MCVWRDHSAVVCCVQVAACRSGRAFRWQRTLLADASLLFACPLNLTCCVLLGYHHDHRVWFVKMYAHVAEDMYKQNDERGAASFSGNVQVIQRTESTRSYRYTCQYASHSGCGQAATACHAATSHGPLAYAVEQAANPRSSPEQVSILALGILCQLLPFCLCTGCFGATADEASPQAAAVLSA